jgi:hypothetical protein
VANTTLNEVMRGHLEECLEHFRKRFNSKIRRGQRGRFEAVKPLMDFCEIGDKTALKLMDDGVENASPKGRILLKVLCYLDFHGYKVIEFERLPKILRNFAELIGYGVMSTEEAAVLAGYPSDHHLHGVLWGREGLGKDKETKMWQIWKGRRDELEQKKRDAFESYRLEILFKTDQQADQLGHQSLLLLDSVGGDTARRLALINILKGTLGFFDGGLFDNLSSYEIKDLKQSGGHTIHRLVAHLSNLSLKISTPEEE